MIRRNQKLRVLEFMQKNGSITHYDAETWFGCTRLPARIKELKDEGHVIKRRFERGVNRFGEPTHYARYFLAEKPEEQKGA